MIMKQTDECKGVYIERENGHVIRGRNRKFLEICLSMRRQRGHCNVSIVIFLFSIYIISTYLIIIL